ncbi:MAG: hypothetical protein AAF744_03075 [Pseudomonadota bacterium]
MNTWSSSALLLSASLALSSCGAVQLPSFGGADKAPLTRSLMASGAVTLVPPQGFCIDPRSLNQQFALMARCDTLGAPAAAGGAALALITVSFTTAPEDAALPTALETADAAKLARVDAAKSENRAITFRAEGIPPVSDLDVTHWRGTARLGAHVMGVALYGPMGGRAISSEGREIINDLIRRTRAAS